MAEAAVALFIALIAFAVGYGNLQQKVAANKEMTEKRIDMMQKELDSLRESNDSTLEKINKLLVVAEGITKDIQYIKENLEK